MESREFLDQPEAGRSWSHHNIKINPNAPITKLPAAMPDACATTETGGQVYLSRLPTPHPNRKCARAPVVPGVRRSFKADRLFSPA
jgi:hypothetical protein